MRKSMILLLLLLGSCEKESNECADSDFFNDVNRNFKMGFTTWNYAPENEAVEDTYDFIMSNGDIYAEQIDEYIPWDSWINGEPLSQDFLLKMEFKSQRRPSDMPLSLSVSFLDTDRSALLPDQDGSVPENTGFDDIKIIDAYEKHLKWLVEKFKPEYLVFAMEVGDLVAKDQVAWEAYKRFSNEIRKRLRASYPNLRLSESITLHSWFESESIDQETYNAEMKAFLSDLDFAAVSYYAFLKGQSSRSEFQRAFDFLHNQVDLPIAIVETNHLAETLRLNSFNLTIESDACEQKAFLETLLDNAQANNYEYVIWWSHRDYDELWETFPEEVKDIGKLWRDTGLLDESGNPRPAYDCWTKAFNN